MSKEEQPKREPFLDKDELYIKYHGDYPGNVGSGVIDEIIDFYEAKITSGELMVVEYVTADKDGKCSKCGSYTDDGDLCDAPLLFVYCPGCGSKITR